MSIIQRNARKMGKLCSFDNTSEKSYSSCLYPSGRNLVVWSHLSGKGSGGNAAFSESNLFPNSLLIWST